MSLIEIKVPSPGESIAEVQLANWLVSDGDFVERDQEIAEIDSKIITLAYDFNETHELDRLENTGPKPYKHCHRISDDKCEVITDFNTVDTYFLASWITFPITFSSL